MYWVFAFLLQVMLLLILTISMISILFKTSFFQILVLFEVSLLLAAIFLLYSYVSPWFILPLFGIGACEGSLGLSVSVWLSRSITVSSFAL